MRTLRAPTPLQLSGVALAWGLLVLSAGFWFPAYSGTEETCLGGGGCVSADYSSTLVAQNGTGVLLVLAVPAIASAVLVGLLLAAPQAPLTRFLGWCLAAGLWVLSVLGMASIGMYVVPSALLLTLAVGRLSSQPAASGAG